MVKGQVVRTGRRRKCQARLAEVWALGGGGEGWPEGLQAAEAPRMRLVTLRCPPSPCTASSLLGASCSPHAQGAGILCLLLTVVKEEVSGFLWGRGSRWEGVGLQPSPPPSSPPITARGLPPRERRRWDPHRSSPCVPSILLRHLLCVSHAWSF